VFVERIGMAVRSRAFVRFEVFDGSVYLLVGNIFKNGAWRWVKVVRVDVVVLWVVFTTGNPRVWWISEEIIL